MIWDCLVAEWLAGVSFDSGRGSSRPLIDAISYYSVRNKHKVEVGKALGGNSIRKRPLCGPMRRRDDAKELISVTWIGKYMFKDCMQRREEHFTAAIPIAEMLGRTAQ